MNEGAGQENNVDAVYGTSSTGDTMEGVPGGTSGLYGEQAADATSLETEEDFDQALRDAQAKNATADTSGAVAGEPTTDMPSPQEGGDNPGLNIGDSAFTEPEDPAVAEAEEEASKEEPIDEDPDPKVVATELPSEEVDAIRAQVKKDAANTAAETEPADGAIEQQAEVVTLEPEPVAETTETLAEQRRNELEKTRKDLVEQRDRYAKQLEEAAAKKKETMAEAEQKRSEARELRIKADALETESDEIDLKADAELQRAADNLNPLLDGVDEKLRALEDIERRIKDIDAQINLINSEPGFKLAA